MVRRILGTDYNSGSEMGRGLLRQAAQDIQSTNDSLSRGVSLQSKLSAQITQDAIDANNAAAKAKIPVQKTGVSGWGMLSQSLANIYKTEVERKRYEEQLELERERIELQRQKELQRLQEIEDNKRNQEAQNKAFAELTALDADKMFADGKGDLYFNQVDYITRDITNPEYKEKLINYASQQFAGARENRARVISEGTKEINKSLKEQTMAQSELVLSGKLHQLFSKNPDGVSPSQVLETVNSTIMEFEENNANYQNLSVADKIAIRTNYLIIAKEEYEKVAGESEELNQAIVRHNQHSNDVANFKTQYRKGEIGLDTYNYLVENSAIKNQIPLSQSNIISDLNKNIEQDITELANKQRLDELQANGLVQDLNAVQYSNDYYGLNAYKAATDPLYRNYLENDPVMSKTNEASRILALADNYNKFLEISENANTQVAQIESQIKLLQSGTVNELRKLAQNDRGLVAELEVLGVDVTGLQEIKKDTTELDEAYVELRNQAVGALRTKQQSILNEARRLESNLKPYGLTSPGELEAARMRHESDNSDINTAHQQARQNNLLINPTNSNSGKVPEGDSNFNVGVQATPNQTLKSPKDGWVMATPFRPGQKVSYRDGWGRAGTHRHTRTRNHGGIDIMSPVGTELVSMVNGTVETVGYEKNLGNFVDIKDDVDGMIWRYVHLDKVYAKQGQRVVPNGKTIGTVGQTGNARGTPPHVHLEYRRVVGGAFSSTEDVDQALNNLHKRNQASAQRQQVVNPVAQRPSPGVAVSTTRVMPNDKAFYAQPDAAKNYGIKYLAENDDVRRAFNKAAKRLNIPGEWLGDYISNISGWNTKAVNRKGCAGLVLMCPISGGRDIAGMDGITVDDISNMNPSQQIRAVEKYIEPVKERIVSPAHLAAYLWGGENLLATLESDSTAASEWSDGNVSFDRFVSRMGRFSGRVYEVEGADNRRSYFANKY